MKILVTGGAGYIGSHTVRELVRRGDEVIVFDSLEQGHAQAVEQAGQVAGRQFAPRLIEGTILDSAKLDEVLSREQPQAVIHFAAYKAPGESVENPSRYFHNNVEGTRVLLDAIRRNGVNYFIFSSSCSVFGTPQNLPASETNNPFNPESPYAETKFMVERMLKWYDVAYGLRSVSLRYFNAAGADMQGDIGEDWTVTLNLIPLVMKAAVGRAPAVNVYGTDYPTPDGSCIRDFIHVTDLAAAHIAAVENLMKTNQTTSYNLGTGRGSSVKEIVALTKKVSGVDFKVIETDRRPGDPIAIWADNTKAKTELGWLPRYDLEDIIGSAWRWHSTHPDGYKS